MNKEEKIKALSKRVDFYIMELMSFEKLPTWSGEELKNEIIQHLKIKLEQAMKEYKEEISKP